MDNNKGFVHVLLSLWDHPSPSRRQEILTCLRKNIQNPHIERIHVFYESTGGLLFDKDLLDPKIKLIAIKEYPTYKTFIDYANQFLSGSTVAIINADIYFDDSLALVKACDLSQKVLALTRYNLGEYKNWKGELWERNFNSQDAWIFKAPLLNVFSDIRIGYLGCDSWIAYELAKAGLEVLNPSLDIKIWHMHEERELISDDFSNEKSYHSKIFNGDPLSELKFKSLPIESLKRWKIYTIYSSSHEKLYREWFLGTMKDDYEVVARKVEQSCKQAEYMSEGWIETVLNKIPLILEAIDTHFENGFFIFSDVDVQWFSPTKNRLQEILAQFPEKDIFFQQDAIKMSSGLPNVCTGFFVCKANKRTREFWNMVAELMRQKNWGDQMAVNHILKEELVKGLKTATLPRQFWGAASGVVNPLKWEQGLFLEPPQDILCHHANWTVGIPNKIKQLEYILRKKALMDFKKDHFLASGLNGRKHKIEIGI